MRPFVPKLLDALLICFKDESWPVRDGKADMLEPVYRTMFKSINELKLSGNLDNNCLFHTSGGIWNEIF